MTQRRIPQRGSAMSGNSFPALQGGLFMQITVLGLPYSQ